jgi:cytochrome c oxidase subunit II
MNSPVLWPAGAAAQSIAVIGWVLLIGAALILAGVMLLLARSLQRRETPRRVRPALWLIGGGVVFPAVVLSALLGWSIALGARLAQPAPPGAMVVSVTGHMWWWEVRYRDPASGADVVLANELRLPVGRPIVVGLNSADVIHSFWVPALAGKVDAVPGRVAQLVFSATEAGVFPGPCAEYCGQQHARMTLQVVAQPQAEFDRWLAGQARPAAEPVTPLQRQGRQAFVAERCIACHTVRGVGHAVGPRAPDLTHVGSRLSLGAGTLRNDPGALIAWIADVQHLKPGARMPSFNALDAPTLQAIGAYLAHLQ